MIRMILVLLALLLTMELALSHTQQTGASTCSKVEWCALGK